MTLHELIQRYETLQRQDSGGSADDHSDSDLSSFDSGMLTLATNTQLLLNDNEINLTVSTLCNTNT